MLMTDVPTAAWAGYFERVTGETRNAWVTIEVESDELGRQVEARNLLLEDLGYDRRDDVFEVAAFHPGPKGRAVLRHLIDGPVRIAVNSLSGILPTEIAIESRDGTRTTVRLHDGAALSS